MARLVRSGQVTFYHDLETWLRSLGQVRLQEMMSGRQPGGVGVLGLRMFSSHALVPLSCFRRVSQVGQTSREFDQRHIRLFRVGRRQDFSVQLGRRGEMLPCKSPFCRGQVNRGRPLIVRM